MAYVNPYFNTARKNFCLSITSKISKSSTSSTELTSFMIASNPKSLGSLPAQTLMYSLYVNVGTQTVMQILLPVATILPISSAILVHLILFFNLCSDLTHDLTQFVIYIFVCGVVQVQRKCTFYSADECLDDSVVRCHGKTMPHLILLVYTFSKRIQI